MGKEESARYKEISKICNNVFTREEVMTFLAKPTKESPVYEVVHRTSELIQSNPTYPFSYYSDEDLYQLCWTWAYEVFTKEKYDYKTSLFSYLETIFRRKVFRLKRDKQWYTKIARQKTCETCAKRDTCERKVIFEDRFKTPECPVKDKALKRNEARYDLSVQMDDDITKREDFSDPELIYIANDLLEVFEEKMPDKYKEVFRRMVSGNTVGIKRRLLTSTRRYCFKLFKQIYGEEAYQEFIKTYGKIYWREYRRKERRKKKKLKEKP